MSELLTCREMAAIDAAAAAQGLPVSTLMEAAGWQVARLIRRHFAVRPVLVLCGPGQNGGDGLVVARLLARWGWPVTVAAMPPAGGWTGVVGMMASRWHGPIHPLSPTLLMARPLVVDALLGAGLTRPLDGIAAAMVAAVEAAQVPVVAVDVPSGLDGDSGVVRGVAAKAVMTVTFFRAKPGHYLLPGRELCGRLEIADIGIPAALLADVAPQTACNNPALWRHCLPKPTVGTHKYQRGHLLLAGGEQMTGAARLAAAAARRAGVGLVTIAAPTKSQSIYRADAAGVIVEDAADWDRLLADPRKNCLLLGPGLGIGESCRQQVLTALAARKACVLDADALTSFADHRESLRHLSGTIVMTPHDGEYARLFDHQGDRLIRARAAAQDSGAVVILKGSDSVIAAPDGRAAINHNAPPSLATAGSGDVLAGLVAGLLAQSMPAFEAACAAVWLHGDGAAHAGPGLIAEDLVSGLPAAWQRLSD